MDIATRVTRRQLLLSAAGVPAALASTSVETAVQQPAGPTPEDVGKWHGTKLRELTLALNKESLYSEPGLTNVVRYLGDQKDLGLVPSDLDLLRELVRAVFASKELAALINALVALAKKAADKTHAVVRATIAIARNSAEYVRDTLKDLDYNVVIRIIASDVGGALSGFGACSVLPPPLRIAGALAGAVSASVLAQPGSALVA